MIFLSKTRELYDALGDETRLSILILMRSKKKVNIENLGTLLGGESKEAVEYHLNILMKNGLIQKSKRSLYSLTEEGNQRLLELGITMEKADKLTEERENEIESFSHDGIDDIQKSEKPPPLLGSGLITGTTDLPIEYWVNGI